MRRIKNSIQGRDNNMWKGMSALIWTSSAFGSVGLMFQEEGMRMEKHAWTGMQNLVYHAKEFGLKSYGQLGGLERFAAGTQSDLICQLILMAAWKDILKRASGPEPGDILSSVSSANYPLLLLVLLYRVGQNDVCF